MNANIFDFMLAMDALPQEIPGRIAATETGWNYTRAPKSRSSQNSSRSKASLSMGPSKWGMRRKQRNRRNLPFPLKLGILCRIFCVTRADVMPTIKDFGGYK